MLGGLDFKTISATVRRALQPVIGTIGSDGSVLLADSTQSAGARWGVPALRGYIAGLTYSNNASDATNDIDIAAGVAADSTGVEAMTLAAAITKRSDAAWAVGSNAGGLDLIGSAGNNDFYIWLIKRADTGVVDAVFSLSSTAPTMPSGYTLKRLIGWFKRVGGTIVAFDTYETAGGGLELIWDGPTLDVNLAATLTSTRRTDAVKVPLNFSVEAHLNVLVADAAALIGAWVYCPDQADTAPSLSAAPLANVRVTVLGENSLNQIRVRTSVAGLIAARAVSGTFDTYAVATMGFTWARRN